MRGRCGQEGCDCDYDIRRQARTLQAIKHWAARQPHDFKLFPHVLAYDDEVLRRGECAPCTIPLMVDRLVQKDRLP